MPAFRTIQARYTLFLVLFILLLSVLTVVGISQLVAPKLRHTEEQVVLNRIAEVAEQIQGELNKVQAQQRSITQTIPLLDSAAIDTVLPGLVDQYGELKVFGGGIWPLPGQREAGRNKFSTFWHRDASGKLAVNTFWNSDAAPNYYDQSWYKGGMATPRGRRLTRMTPAPSRAPTAPWPSRKTAMPGACRPSTSLSASSTIWWRARKKTSTPRC
jgi:methyl-accepting chemotaxis protein